MNVSNGTGPRNHVTVPRLDIAQLKEEKREESQYINFNRIESPDSPDTPKTPKSPISSIKIPIEVQQPPLKKRTFSRRLSSNPSLRRNKTELIAVAVPDPVELKKLTTSKQIKHYSLKASNEDSLLWISEIIRENNGTDLPNIKIQETVKEIFQKLSYPEVESSFLKFQTTIHRICFLNLLSGNYKNRLINLCSNLEIDLMIASIEDFDFTTKEEHIEKCNQIINLLSEERKAEYFKTLQNFKDFNFISALESSSPIKLNIALKNLWLKNIPVLAQAVSITKMLDCPRKDKVVTVTSRDISWRCKQFKSKHWAALLPVLSLITIKDLRLLGHLNYAAELLAYGKMEYSVFKELIKKNKVHPELCGELLLTKILELKNNTEFRAELKFIKKKMIETDVKLSNIDLKLSNLDLKLSNIIYELKRINQEQLEGTNIHTIR